MEHAGFIQQQAVRLKVGSVLPEDTLCADGMLGIGRPMDQAPFNRILCKRRVQRIPLSGLSNAPPQGMAKGSGMAKPAIAIASRELGARASNWPDIDPTS